MGLFSETFLVVVLLVVTHLSIYLYLKRKPPKDIKDRHVVVTGGSSGIGLWLAIHSAKLGAHVTIIARNVTNLGKFDQTKTLPGENVTPSDRWLFVCKSSDGKARSVAHWMVVSI